MSETRDKIQPDLESVLIFFYKSTSLTSIKRHLKDVVTNRLGTNMKFTTISQIGETRQRQESIIDHGDALNTVFVCIARGTRLKIQQGKIWWPQPINDTIILVVLPEFLVDKKEGSPIYSDTRTHTFCPGIPA